MSKPCDLVGGQMFDYIGQRLSPEEEAALGEHISSCSTCRELEERCRIFGQGLRPEPSDDSLVEARVARGLRGALEGRPRRGRVWLGGLALAGAGALAAVLVIMLIPEGREPAPPLRAVAPPVAPGEAVSTPVVARPYLMIGAAALRVDGILPSAMAEGERLEVPEGGRVVMSWGPGVVAEMREGSALTFLRLREDRREIALHRGAVFVRVRPGGMAVSVRTPDLVAEVVGTEFWVSRTGAESLVAVREGTVRVIPLIGASGERRIEAGHQIRCTGQGEVEVGLASEEVRGHMDDARGRFFSFEEPQGQAYLVVPGEAEQVEVGGRILGPGPLVAMVVPGAVRVRIRRGEGQEEMTLSVSPLSMVSAGVAEVAEPAQPKVAVAARPRRVISRPAVRSEPVPVKPPPPVPAEAKAPEPAKGEAQPAEVAVSPTVEALYRKAEVLLGEGRFGEAADILERVADQARGNRMSDLAMLDAARLAAGPLNDALRARGILRELLRRPMDKDMANEARLLLCDILSKGGEISEALVCLSELEGTSLGSEAALRGARLLWSKGRRGEALVVYRHYLNLSGGGAGMSEALWRLGEDAYERGEHGKAREYLEEFLAIVPRGRQSERARRLLRGMGE